MRKTIQIYIIGIIAFFASLIFDRRLAIKSMDLRFSAMDSIMRVITSTWTAVAFALACFFLLVKKKKGIVLAVSAISSFAIGSALQMLIARPRPDIAQLVFEGSFSMPSTHAITLFALLPVMIKEYPKQAWLWIAVAGLITFSRFYSGVHYASDLIAGAMLGYLIGLGVLWLDKKYKFGVF